MSKKPISCNLKNWSKLTGQTLDVHHQIWHNSLVPNEVTKKPLRSKDNDKRTLGAYALKNIRIGEDNNGLFARVPDQSGKWMTVRCVESKTSVFASHCSCHTFSQKQHCDHVELVQAYWSKIYMVATPKVEAPVETPKAHKPRNGLVRKVRNGGLVCVAQPAPVAKVIAKAVEASVPVAKTTDISTKDNLNGQRAFGILR